MEALMEQREEVEMSEGVETAIAALAARMDERFDRFDERFDRVDERLAQAKSDREELKFRIDRMEDRIDARFEQVDQRFAHSDQQTGKLSDRLVTSAVILSGGIVAAFAAMIVLIATQL
jgi:flagellar capping protein FliD